MNNIFINKTFKSPIFLIIGLFCFCLPLQASKLFEPSDSLKKNRVWGMSSVAFSGSGLTIYLLSQQWYSKDKPVPFHWFNDEGDWLYMDKLGHGLTSYYGGLYGYTALRWTGIRKNKALLLGGVYGFSFLLTTEIMDGYSSGWGASPSDLVANGLGSLLFMGQEFLLGKQAIVPKFSYWPTNFAKYRPDILGSTHWNRWLKDYNGQTYWFSINPSALGLESFLFPKWLSVSLGYGADGMLGGKFNPRENEEGDFLPYFDRKSEFFLSLDINWSSIRTKSHFLNTVIRGLSFVKMPFPALRLYNKKLNSVLIQY